MVQMTLSSPLVELFSKVQERSLTYAFKAYVFFILYKCFQSLSFGQFLYPLHLILLKVVILLQLTDQAVNTWNSVKIN